MVFWLVGGRGDNIILGRPLPPTSLTIEAAQRWERAAPLCAANTLPHIADALGVGRALIFKVKKLVESGQGLALLKRCVIKRSVR